MSTDAARSSATAMAEAVNILAQGDNYVRALAVHHPGSGGRCASCGQRMPCTMASLAAAAQAEAATIAARAARTAQRGGQVPTPPGSTPGPATGRVEPYSRPGGAR